MALADFASPTLWREDLDTRWPERLPMKSLLIETITHLGTERPGARLLELGVGDAEVLARIAAALPQARLAAADINPGLLDHARAAMGLRAFEGFVQNLGEPWRAITGKYDAIFSLQSLHDVGGQEALASVYAQAAEHLHPGGVLLNADFIVAFAQDDPAAPRRFPAQTHTSLMRECGLSDVAVLGRHGKLGCIRGVAAAL